MYIKYGIHTSRTTHGGRHLCVIEAVQLGIPSDLVRLGGNWKDRLRRLVAQYMGKLSSHFAMGTAGFQDKPFYLKRNAIQPSLALQRRIFPWIEYCYKSYRSYRHAWRRKYNLFMMGHDGNRDDNDNSDNDEGQGLEFIQEHDNSEQA